ncbi:MAG: D-aminoacyl-tRNA deacylase [Candidatus Marinimicrobia bacterium]|nr:D-aminoacyl-tRNA deacylase [Candidatus Neomarinimicrobiota bacterium]
MITVIQRAKSGSVSVDEKVIGQIEYGFVILLGVTNTDEETDADYLAEKIVNLRVFNDKNEKMNLSIQDVNGSALVISQFTLCGDTRKGRRPSFIHAAAPEKGEALYEYFMEQLKSKGIPVESGEFGAMMDVALLNNGPVTFVIDSNRP